MLKRGLVVIGIIWGSIALFLGLAYVIGSLSDTTQFIITLILISIVTSIFLYPIVDGYFTDREEIKQYLRDTNKEEAEDE